MTLAAARRGAIVQAAIGQGHLHPSEALLAAFIDLDGVAENVKALNDTFSRYLPNSTPALHAFAVKANCLIPVLAELGKLGMGCEVASEGELAQALSAGIPPERIVFDSPAKTWRELNIALALGVAVNADNLQELDRIAQIQRHQPSSSPIGIRINPQVGTGAIEAMSTAGATSKFGVALADPGVREQLHGLFREHAWLTRVHAHIGSQGCPLPLIAQGLADVADFADEINSSLGRQQVKDIDIGGGLPVDFDGDDPASDFEGYLTALKEGAPRLFSGDYGIVTEFGRTILAKYGFMAAYVEYTKVSGEQHIAITHAGAHVATRTAFMPEAWPLRVEARDAHGRLKDAPVQNQDIAGPCCFAGDLVARDRSLPLLEQGDIITVLDTGAYYFSTPFTYNSLTQPGVHGARISEDGDVQFTWLRKPQSVEELLGLSGLGLVEHRPSTVLA